MGTPEDPGVTFRSINHLLDTCKENDQIEYTITVGLLEVYLDKLVDLMSDKPVAEQTCAIKTGKVIGLERREVTTTEEVIAVMDEGKANRKVASTFMNSESSRSHLVVFSSIHSGAKHVPFRNSKLTHVLQEVMTVDTKVCIFMHVSSAVANLGETLSTIRFGGTI